ncbi:MAG: hypothetical protein H6515_14610 [Microthrixaceae bacterium]|nr:hypothetical protein [Microthrixaceae bacterium]
MRAVVTLRPAGKGPTLTFELDGDDQVTGGVGGWEAEQAGKKKRPVVRWAGTPGWNVQLPLVLDGVRGEKSVEAACRRITAWGRPQGDAKPTRLKLDGPVRVPASVVWVIDSIELGAQMRRNDGRRIMQELTLTLVEYHPAPAKTPPAKKHRDKKKP